MSSPYRSIKFGTLLNDGAAQSENRPNVRVRASARSLLPTDDQQIRGDREECAVVLP